MKEEEVVIESRKEDGEQNLSIPGVLVIPSAAAVAGSCASPFPDDVDTTTTANFMDWDVTGERGKATRQPRAVAPFIAPHVLKVPHFLTMYDEGDDTRFPPYHHQHLHQLYTQEIHQVAQAAAAAVAEETQQEGAEEDNEEEEEEGDDEEEDDEEEEEGEEEDVEEDAIDDDEDEDEEEHEDEDDEGDEDGRDPNQHNYEQDFELEQRDNRIAVTPNLNNGVELLATAGLVSPVPPQQGQQLAGRVEGPQLVVGLDIKPIIRDDWTEPATHALLDAWGERYMQLNKGNLKQEDWEEVALVVSSMSKTHKTDVQCKNRLDTLKKKYKVEKQKQSAIGSSDSKWPFYKQLDKLLSATIKTAGIPGAVDAGHPVKSSAAVDGFRGEQLKGVRKFEVEDTRAETPPNNASTCSKSKESPGMTISSTEHGLGTDGTQSSTRKRKCLDTPFKTLAKAITKFGEIYEKMEQSKQQQLMDLEKIRMEFTRDLELQRMQLFMQTQVELAKMKHGDNDIDATVSNLSG